MTHRDEFILSLARRAYQEKPFYRWLYDSAGVDVERAGVQDIPFVTKKDIARYEEETGQPYYLPIAYPESQIEYRRTSGTTGRPTTFPWLKAEWFFLCQSILLNFITQIKGRPRFLICVNPDEEERAKAFGAAWVSVPQARQSDVAYVLDMIRTHRPTVLVDSSPGIWFNYLLDHGLDPRQAGIQLVLVLPNPELAEKAESLGVKYGSIFGCTEGGMFGYSHGGIGEVYHLSDAEPADLINQALSNRAGRLGGLPLQLLTRLFPCDCYQGLNLQSLVGKRDICVRTQNGRLETTGAGELAITCANSAFPLIKLLNGDLVEIYPPSECPCGFDGRSMRFHRREHEVQVPYAGLGGIPNTNLERIARHLEGFRRVLPVYVALDAVLRMVVTFVEDDTVAWPRVDDTLADRVMMVGTGMSAEDVRAFSSKSYLPFYPVICVPPGTLPIRDSASLKSRLYLDTVSGYVPDEYRPVLSLVDQLVDRAAIIRSGSWFLSVEVSQPTPA